MEKKYTAEDITQLLKNCIEDGRKYLPGAYRYNNAEEFVELFEKYMKHQNDPHERYFIHNNQELTEELKWIRVKVESIEKDLIKHLSQTKEI